MGLIFVWGVFPGDGHRPPWLWVAVSQTCVNKTPIIQSYFFTQGLQSCTDFPPFLQCTRTSPGPIPSSPASLTAIYDILMAALHYPVCARCCPTVSHKTFVRPSESSEPEEQLRQKDLEDIECECQHVLVLTPHLINLPKFDLRGSTTYSTGHEQHDIK